MSPYAATQARPQGGAEVWTCQCGAGLDEACQTPSKSCRVDAEFVIHKLERAGATLLAMRTRSPMPAPYRCALPEPLRDIYDVWDWKEPATSWDNRPAIPNAAAVTAMDRTFRWLSLIDSTRHVLRRIVAIRSLVNPITGKHVIPWRRLGVVIHSDHHAAQRWHAEGIRLIVARLQT